MNTGIYKISSPSGGFYVGSAVDFGSRKRLHFHLLRNEKHHNLGLSRACKKYGIENLKFEPLIICKKQDLLFFEQRSIDILKPRYNACPTAGSQLGRSHSAASIAKMKKNRIGKGFHSEERKRKSSERMKGNRFNKGKFLSKAHRAKISEVLRGKRHRDGFESRVTSDQKAAIVKAYLAGSGQNALASKYKTEHRVIHRILIAGGVVISRSGHTIKNGS